MKHYIPEDLRWYKFDGPPGSDWYGSEFDGITCQMNLATRRAEIHLAVPDASDDDLTAAADLMGSIGLGFPRTEAELAYAIMNEALSPFATVKVDHDEGDGRQRLLASGVWLFVAAF
jgi:hypothetical protein